MRPPTTYNGEEDSLETFATAIEAHCTDPFALHDAIGPDSAEVRPKCWAGDTPGQRSVDEGDRIQVRRTNRGNVWCRRRYGRLGHVPRT